MRNDTLQNNLVKLLKYLAKGFGNLEFWKTKKSTTFAFMRNDAVQINLV